MLGFALIDCKQWHIKSGHELTERPALAPAEMNSRCSESSWSSSQVAQKFSTLGLSSASETGLADSTWP